VDFFTVPPIAKAPFHGERPDSVIDLRCEWIPGRKNRLAEALSSVILPYSYHVDRGFSCAVFRSSRLRRIFKG
jgi:hypothetical protein